MEKLKKLVEMIGTPEYGKEISREAIEYAKQHGIVICYGHSDDLVEFRGAFDSEFSAWGGIKFRILPIVNKFPPCDRELMSECPLFNSLTVTGTIDAIWSDDENYAPWTVTTSLPFESFNIYDDGELWSVGAVFHISSEDKIWSF